MRGKRYIAVIALSWITLLVLGWYFIYDIPRMESAELAHQKQLADIGAVMYAQNCVVCHGPAGEGVVGPPLNIEAFRGSPRENKEVYDLIYRTIDVGRPGTTTAHWVLLPNNQWASYTAMPMWGAAHGGPMNEQQIAALSHFIMMGDWGSVGRHIPNADPSSWRNPDGTIQYDKLPNGLLAAEDARAGKEIFVNKGCIGCHALGSVGGAVGPDLTKVGSWAEESVWREFLKEWIAAPEKVENRAPVYWSNYGGPYQFPIWVSDSSQSQSGVSGQSATEGAATADEAGQTPMGGGSAGPDIPIPNTEPLPPTLMPNLGLTDEEIETLVDYLMNLK